ncbi:MAG: hypothetical protein ABIQ32_01165 [Sphingomicrobium sp.]
MTEHFRPKCRLAVGLVAIAAGACAMSVPHDSALRCRVTAGAKLLAPAGGPAALCAAVERALAPKLAAAATNIELRVGSRSMFTAAVSQAGGKPLPEFHFTEADRAMSAKTFETFAAALARYIAETRGDGGQH